MSLVHESETQRQHVRATVPGNVELETPDGARRCRLHDLSAGGLAFEVKGGDLVRGQVIAAHIHLSMEGIAVSVPVQLKIVYIDRQLRRAGACFERVGASQVATLRRVVGAYLGGEVIGVGEVLHTLSRNNFTQPRDAVASAPPRSLFARARAVMQTALIVVLGVTALIYTAHRVDEKLFGANSTAGRVSGPNYRVVMPRDGVFHSLVPADGIVQKGAPIGSFETSIFGLVSAQALQAALTPQQIDSLLGKQIKGTVTSPCACRVTEVYATDDQYVGKGERVADLAPMEFEPHVLARFGFREATRVQPGTPVTIRVNGEPLARAGVVAQIRGGDDLDNLSSDVVVVVKPTLPMPMDLVNRAVQVSADQQPWLSTLHVDQMASLFGTNAEARP